MVAPAGRNTGKQCSCAAVTSSNAHHQPTGRAPSPPLAGVCGHPAQALASSAAPDCRPGSQCQWLISPMYSPIALSVLSLELASSDSLAIYDGPAANSSRLLAMLTGAAQAAARAGVRCSPAQRGPGCAPPVCSAQPAAHEPAAVHCGPHAAGRVNPALLCSQLHAASIHVPASQLPAGL